MSSARRVAVTGAIATLLASTVVAAPTALAAPTAPIACPDAFPTASAVDGVLGTGFTVERGTTPDPFSARVLGRIDDGIAPGIDMIMADLSSPALTRAGGVWGGMSGSPVYTDDGKLIGAVAYGLAGNSPIAGITPAVEMKKLLAAGTNVAPAAKVAVNSAEADRIARTGKVTKAAASSGFRRLKLPVSVSGISTDHSAKAFERLQKRMPDTVLRVGGGAKSAAAPASEIVAGGNFGAALSYGTATLAGVGTTTFVCDGKAVAFGHPFLFGGAENQMSMHPATAVYVQADPLFGPFKVANFGGVAGTVTQDRMAGIRGTLGQAPVTANVSTQLRVPGGTATTRRTTAVTQSFMDQITAIHTLAAIDRELDAIGKGVASVQIRVAGTRANGAAFTVTRNDKIADPYDVSGAVAFTAYDMVSSIVNQPFEKVRITGVSIKGTVSPEFAQFRITSAKVKQGSKWVGPSTTVKATAGTSLTVRTTLAQYQNAGPPRTADFTVPVPASAKGTSGSLDVGGGIYVDTPEPKTFNQLVAQIKAAPRGDSLIGLLQVSTESGRTISSLGTRTLTQALAPSDTFFEVVVR